MFNTLNKSIKNNWPTIRNSVIGSLISGGVFFGLNKLFNKDDKSPKVYIVVPKSKVDIPIETNKNIS